MSTALARTQDASLTDEQIALLKNTIAKGASDAEFGLFVQTCKRLHLDPFARQIFLVKRWDSALRCEVAQSQVSIDGFRLVAERTREYRGQTQPEWCGKDGKWCDVWLSDEPPAAARVGVHRQGFAEPMVRVAKYTSYVQLTKDKQSGHQRPNRMWATMPEVMLAKCAEALALRAAFPHELSGVYTSEEMGQDENEEALAKQERPFDGERTPNTQTRARTRTTASAKTSMTHSLQTSETGDRVCAQLRTELDACVDGEQLADFRKHALEMMDGARIQGGPRKQLWAEWAARCKALGLVPADVAAAADERAA